MTTEDQLALSLFKAGSSLMQSAIEHAASESGDEKQAEFFRRELEKKERMLARKLSTDEIPLHVDADSVLLSPPG